MAFVGPCPDGMEACHNDGNPANNNLENLRWDTHKSNMWDKIKHGTIIRGEKHPRSILTSVAVREIRSLWKTGLYTQQKLADMYGVKQMAISKIVRGKTWGWLK